MQDKIQEIMVLVEDYHEYGHQSYKDAIESKLRELVREPLKDEEVELIISDAPCSDDSYGHVDCSWIIRETERAHNITNTSGEA